MTMRRKATTMQRNTASRAHPSARNNNCIMGPCPCGTMIHSIMDCATRQHRACVVGVLGVLRGVGDAKNRYSPGLLASKTAE